MKLKKRIIGLCGSASQNSGNLAILHYLKETYSSEMEFEIIDNLSELPHFRTELTDHKVPEAIKMFRNKISKADGVLFCTPEYIFSIPSALKNALEWSVSTTIFSTKPVGIITASASGEKGHEELKLIMKTLQSTFSDDTTLLISGIKGKIITDKKIPDEKTKKELNNLFTAFKKSLS